MTLLNTVHASLLLLVLLLLSPAPAAAILTMKLYSTDYAHFTSSRSLEENIADTTSHAAPRCVLLDLHREAPTGLVRFAHSSNYSGTPYALPLVVSTHRATVDTDSPDFGNPSFITSAVTHLPESLLTLKQSANSELEKSPQNAKKDTEEYWAKRSLNVVVNIVQKDRGGPRKLYYEGYYGVCFSLDYTAWEATSSHRTRAPEEVTIRLLELRSRGATYTAPLEVREPGSEKRVYEEAMEDYLRLRRLNEQTAQAAGPYLTSADQQETLESLSKVHETLDRVWAGLGRVSQLEERMRNTAESTFTRVWVCAIIIAATAAACVVLMFHSIKDMLVRKKLV